jgi:dual specificity phosphatase 3
VTRKQPELANAHFVTDQLAVGGDFDTYDEGRAVRQVRELVGLGLTHIIDVRLEWDDSEFLAAVAPEVSYLHDGIDDAGQRVAGEWFDGVTTWALDALADPSAKLLVHCHMGVNRAPSSALAILLALDWDVVDALDAIRAARPVAFIAYAEDVLRWHHARRGASDDDRARDLAVIQQWRRDNDLDMYDVIRRLRVEEDQQDG